MRKDWKYILYLALIIGIFVIAQMSRAKQYDWTITFSHEDKNPFGTKALNDLLETEGINLKNSYKTLYELKDSLRPSQAVVIIASSMRDGKEDIDVLLNHVAKGGEALIAADYFSGKLSDSLGISCYDNLFKDKELFMHNDTATLHFVNPHLDTAKTFPYRRDNIHNYFGRIDSVKAAVIVKNEIGQTVMVRINHGKGRLFLLCAPMIFTNIHLLSKENHEFAAGILSFLTSKEILRTEFYHLGRMEAGSPLRFILNNEPLRWAYYISMVALLLFMIFEAKRRQRIIPVIKPFTNSTLEFVSTIGNLYYQKSDHKNIGEKKIQFFFDQVRSQYNLNANQPTENFAELLARKSGNPVDETRTLLKVIGHVFGSNQLSAEELKRLNRSIEKFWKKK